MPEADETAHATSSESGRPAKLMLLALMAAVGVVAFWDLFVLATDLAH
ncbi:MAG TPA: hypothetical protein VL984_10095 [Acidimicrobiales bacterium]|nr:hypothetical protein [Acidimicrobiales bacterium]